MDRPSSLALRLVLWGMVALVVAAVAFVALVPGPDLPPAYGRFAALHDSMVRGPAAAHGEGFLQRADAHVGGQDVATWLHRHRGALITVHRTEADLPRPRGATRVAGARHAFAFERDDLLFLVTPTGEGAYVLASYTEIGRLRSMMEIVSEVGPRGPPVTRPAEPKKEPRPSAPRAEPPTP